jgi:hypothetical protein
MAEDDDRIVGLIEVLRRYEPDFELLEAELRKRELEDDAQLLMHVKNMLRHVRVGAEGEGMLKFDIDSNLLRPVSLGVQTLGEIEDVLRAAGSDLVDMAARARRDLKKAGNRFLTDTQPID